ncbi:sigma-54-dependent Fis family transcriptional regulator, partial [Candidatus Sumerlaeota bacterium]|nr:sigma-54-dependent Fis family transcriptional regulator [Candidatus Sumerlaeota bacterium]
MRTPALLLIEDDADFAERLSRNLTMEGFRCDIAPTGSEALERLSTQYYDLVVTDIRMPDIDGVEIIRRVKSGAEARVDSDLPMVVLTSVNDVRTAVEAMRTGAADYITKESERAEIVVRLQRVLEQSRLINENRYLKDQLTGASEFAEIVGASDTIKAIKDEIANVARGDATALITGQTGVGKELVARAIHRASARRDGPFVDLNCAGLPDENLLLSELFGHERGAFTDAKALKKGRFELAQGGTLLLDEVSDLSPNAQGKLLRVIETRQFSRLGGLRALDVDCRIICATNADLAEAVAQGRFREDLFYRINVFPIHVPPLRERPDDIPALARYFVGQFGEKYRRPDTGLDDEALEMLCSYSWPGNVRELRNFCERLVIRARKTILDAELVRTCGLTEKRPAPTAPIALPDQGVALDQVEKDLVVAALEKADWNQKRAAELLGISADRINSRVRKWGLRHPSWRIN